MRKLQPRSSTNPARVRAAIPALASALALLPLSVHASAPACPLPAATVEYDGASDPIDARPVWLLDGEADLSPGVDPGFTDFRDGGYIAVSELIGDDSVSWIRVSASIRINAYFPYNEYSGASIGASSGDALFGFFFFERDGERRVAPTEGGLGETGQYIGEAVAPPFEYLDHDFHTWEFLLDRAAGTYLGTVDGETLFEGPVTDLAAEAIDPDEWLSLVPGAFFFSAGSSGRSSAAITVDWVRGEACLTSCPARGLGELEYEANEIPTEMGWPPWFALSEDEELIMTEAGGILTVDLEAASLDDPAEVLLAVPVFSELGRQVKGAIRARQVTSVAAPLAEPLVQTAFGYVQSDYWVMVLLLDHGSGMRSVALDLGYMAFEIGDLSEEFSLDWTEFHNYLLVEHPEDKSVRLYVDGELAIAVTRSGLPPTDNWLGEGFVILQEVYDEPLRTEWDYLRAEFRRDGFEEICDGLDNDCDGLVDNAGQDPDGDTIGHYCDNCPGIPNPDQADTDGDGIGDACETAASCGNGVVDSEPPVLPPPCPKPSKKTNVTTHAELAAWISDPTTSLVIKGDLDFGNEERTLVTACNVDLAGPAELTNLTGLTVYADIIDIHADVEVKGRVELHATTEIIMRNPAHLGGPVTELVLEAPVVWDHGTSDVSGMYCGESGNYTMKPGARVMFGAAWFVRADNVELQGDIIDASSVTILSSNDITVSGSSFRDCGNVRLGAGGHLELNGDFERAGDVLLAGDTLTLPAGASIVDSGDVTIQVAGRFEDGGSIANSGFVSACTSDYLLLAGHDFTDNDSCEVLGTADAASIPAVGCQENGPCPMAVPLSPLTPIVGQPLVCGVSGGQGAWLGLLLWAGLAVLRRR